METINPPLKGRTYHYNSVADIKNIKPSNLVNTKNRERWKGIVSRNKERQGFDAQDWFGPEINSYQDLQNALNRGWGYGMRQVETMTHKIKMPKLESVKRRNVKGPEGDFLDIHKVNKGEFDKAWTRKKRMKKQSKKRFTLTVSIGANFDIEAVRLFWRGVATVTLAKALTTAGHSVEIVAYIAGKGLTKENGTKFHTVTIKSFDMPLNTSSLVGTICLAGFFRTEMFKVLLTDPQDVSPGLGREIGEPLPESILKHKGEMVQVPDNMTKEKLVEQWLAEIVNKI